MSLYGRAWLFVAWVLAVFVSFPIWIPMLMDRLGEAGAIIGVAFWLSHGLVMMFLFRCAKCGLSPFRTSKGFLAWSTPWPQKMCGHCGNDHTEVEKRSSR
jgi:hypothetical protein